MPMKLTPKQIAVANLLVAGKSGRDACHSIGIDQTTLVRWKRQAEFANYVSQLLLDVEKDSMQKLHSLRCRAAERLGELLESTTQSIALKAAEAILERTNQRLAPDGATDNGNVLLLRALEELESIG